MFNRKRLITLSDLQTTANVVMLEIPSIEISTHTILKWEQWKQSLEPGLG